LDPDEVQYLNDLLQGTLRGTPVPHPQNTFSKKIIQQHNTNKSYVNFDTLKSALSGKFARANGSSDEEDDGDGWDDDEPKKPKGPKYPLEPLVSTTRKKLEVGLTSTLEANLKGRLNPAPAKREVTRGGHNDARTSLAALFKPKGTPQPPPVVAKKKPVVPARRPPAVPREKPSVPKTRPAVAIPPIDVKATVNRYGADDIAIYFRETLGTLNGLMQEASWRIPSEQKASFEKELAEDILWVQEVFAYYYNGHPDVNINEVHEHVGEFYDRWEKVLATPPSPVTDYLDDIDDLFSPMTAEEEAALAAYEEEFERARRYREGLGMKAFSRIENASEYFDDE
jgi:hypothetical protein